MESLREAKPIISIPTQAARHHLRLIPNKQPRHSAGKGSYIDGIRRSDYNARYDELSILMD